MPSPILPLFVRFRVVVTLSLLAGVAGQARGQAHSPQPAQHGANPTVSPDGRRIAFVSDRSSPGDIFIMNADGSDVRRLTSDGGHRGRPHWSADGRRLFFNLSSNDTTRVYALSVDGGVPTEVARFAARGGAMPIGDESRFVIGVGPWTAMQLFVTGADGSGRRALTSDRAAYWCPGASPRGDLVAATRQDSASMQIWIIHTDGSGARALTRFTPTQGRPQCAVFSPDARRLAIQSEAADPQDTTREIGHLWIVDVTSGQATRLGEHVTPYRDELPAWFPDGKSLAFQSDRTGRWEVWVMKADGTGAQQVTR